LLVMTMSVETASRLKLYGVRHRFAAVGRREI
jgi:hypothetical protein